MNQYRLFDYAVDNELSDEDDEFSQKNFIIQIFAMNIDGETACITVRDFQPFFYVRVGNSWDESQKKKFLAKIKREIRYHKDKPSPHEKSNIECNLVKKKTLYGFDKGKEYTFIKLKFANTTAFNVVKNLWYSSGSWKDRKLMKWILFGHPTQLSETEMHFRRMPNIDRLRPNPGTTGDVLQNTLLLFLTP